MKTFFKVLLWVLLIGTIVITSFVVASAVVDLTEKPEWVQKLLNFDRWLNWTFYWGYALFATVLVGAIVTFVFNIVNNPKRLLTTLYGLLIVGGIFGIAYYLVKSHDVVAVPNSAGGVFDNPSELFIAEIGIYLTYIVAGIAGLAVIISLLSGVIRKFAK